MAFSDKFGLLTEAARVEASLGVWRAETLLVSENSGCRHTLDPR